MTETKLEKFAETVCHSYSGSIYSRLEEHEDIDLLYMHLTDLKSEYRCRNCKYFLTRKKCPSPNTKESSLCTSFEFKGDYKDG